MNHFVKIYGSLLRSTVWVGQPKHVKLVWLAMLMLADAEGDVAASIPGLAREAEVTVDECEDALKVFMAPDRFSRTKAHDGRRIREIDGGWHVLNHRKYREMRTPSQVANARRQADFKARHREKNQASPDDDRVPFEPVTASVTTVTDVTGNEGNAQRQRQRQITYSNGTGKAKDLKASARGDDDAGLPDPPGFRVPAEWRPLGRHGRRCDDAALDLPEQVTAFRKKRFKTPCRDWSRRFDQWLAAAVKFAAIDGEREPIEDGMTGFESVAAAGEDAA